MKLIRSLLLCVLHNVYFVLAQTTENVSNVEDQGLFLLLKNEFKSIIWDLFKAMGCIHCECVLYDCSHKQSSISV
jgi:hypothetical protein